MVCNFDNINYADYFKFQIMLSILYESFRNVEFDECKEHMAIENLKI